MTQTERQHPDQLAESLQADAELQKAAIAYIAEQSAENRLALRKAVSHLQELIPCQTRRRSARRTNECWT